METYTTTEIIESMDYSGGIDWKKMLPPENEDYQKEWLSKEDIRKELEIIYTSCNEERIFQIQNRLRVLLTKLGGQ